MKYYDGVMTAVWLFNIGIAVSESDWKSLAYILIAMFWWAAWIGAREDWI